MLRVAFFGLLALIFLLAVAIVVTFAMRISGGAGTLSPVSDADTQRVRAELVDRSFRQFEPHRDGDPRKAVIIEFFDGLGLWAQYAEGDHAVDEWEVRSAAYTIKSRGDVADEVTLTFIDAESRQQFPDACEGCIDTSGVSISIRNVFDGDGMRFRINDPDGVLPSPFPVFGSWTRFEEDEYFD
ncbi:MAG: hypothetical protein OXH97_11705 [Chloroflexota bacterium]|nr:hypothetical protein [Chloroflexota bacterium]